MRKQRKLAKKKKKINIFRVRQIKHKFKKPNYLFKNVHNLSKNNGVCNVVNQYPCINLLL